MTDPQEFMAAVSRMIGNPGSGPARPCIEAQHMELSAAFRATQEEHPPLQPGDLVEPRHPLLGIVKDGVALIYWCRGDWSNPVHLALLRNMADKVGVDPQADCILAHVGSEGSLVYSLSVSVHLRKVP